jgi:hypothetical protein
MSKVLKHRYVAGVTVYIHGVAVPDANVFVAAPAIKKQFFLLPDHKKAIQFVLL